MSLLLDKALSTSKKVFMKRKDFVAVGPRRNSADTWWLLKLERLPCELEFSSIGVSDFQVLRVGGCPYFDVVDFETGTSGGESRFSGRSRSFCSVGQIGRRLLRIELW
jgi:hypothetical protein